MQILKTKTAGLILIIVFSLMLVVGCGNQVVGGPTEVDFEKPQEEFLPEEVQSWLEENIQEYGEDTLVHEEELYILAAYGEKPTAGYTVEIYKVEKLDGKILVFVSYEDPNPKDAVAEVITYPYDLVVIEYQGLPVEFKK